MDTNIILNLNYRDLLGEDLRWQSCMLVTWKLIKSEIFLTFREPFSAEVCISSRSNDLSPLLLLLMLFSVEIVYITNIFYGTFFFSFCNNYFFLFICVFISFHLFFNCVLFVFFSWHFCLICILKIADTKVL